MKFTDHMTNFEHLGSSYNNTITITLLYFVLERVKVWALDNIHHNLLYQGIYIHIYYIPS